MALELKGMDGKWYTHASVDILRKHRGERDHGNVMLELLASIGQELETSPSSLNARWGIR